MLQSFLFKIKDHRRPQGRRYRLEHRLFWICCGTLDLAPTYWGAVQRLRQGWRLIALPPQQFPENPKLFISDIDGVAHEELLLFRLYT